jgi:cytochrome c-type biogenesis protein CcmH/NrfF
MHWDTALLWGLPFLAVLGGGGYLLFAARRKRRQPVDVAALSEAEKLMLEARLHESRQG